VAALDWYLAWASYHHGFHHYQQHFGASCLGIHLGLEPYWLPKWAS